MKIKLYSKFRGKTTIKDIFNQEKCYIAGRVINVDGIFVTIEDETGIITLECGYHDLRYLDIAAFELRSNNKKVEVKQIYLLTRNKNDSPLNNRWQKSVIDRGKRETLLKRENIIQNVREYFLNEGFTEINTPYLVYAPSSEETLQPFKVNTSNDKPMYLTMSPEYNLKRYLTAGFERIFQIAHSFRNEEYDNLHNPEFLNLEWYRAFADYTDIMDDLSLLLPNFTYFASDSSVIRYRGKSIDFSEIEKISIKDLFYDDFHEELESLDKIDDFKTVISKKNINTDNLNSWNDLFYAWIVKNEPYLGLNKPCLIYDYPRSCAALARLKDDNNFYAERFELYIGGIEIANAYSELNNPEEQSARLTEELKIHKDIPFNRDFQKALEIGMPPSGGIAFGLDRFIMILLGKNSIHEVMPLSIEDLKDEINTSPR